MNQNKLNRMIISAMTFDAGHHGGQSESEEMFEALKQFEKSIAEDKELNDLVLDALGIAIAHGPKDAICDLEKLHDRVSSKASARWKAGDRFIGGASNEEHIIYYDYVGTEEHKTFGVVRLSDGFHMASPGQEYKNADAFMERHWGLNCKKVEKG